MIYPVSLTLKKYIQNLKVISFIIYFKHWHDRDIDQNEPNQKTAAEESHRC